MNSICLSVRSRQKKREKMNDFKKENKMKAGAKDRLQLDNDGHPS